MSHVPLLIISGPVGVGKTTVSEELNNILSREGIAHTCIDLDGLAETYPRPADDRFNSRLALRNLRDVWMNCAAADPRNLVIPRVVESPVDVEEIEKAVPGDNSTVCLLQASNDTLISRVRKREVGSGRAWHEQRSIELSRQLENTDLANFTIKTDDCAVADIAAEIFERVKWAR